jgi:HSP20 family protein
MVGTFERSVRLPEFVNADRIAASFSNGLLAITVPKAEAAQPASVPGRPASCPLHPAWQAQ